jgi:hypothetical protein
MVKASLVKVLEFPFLIGQDEYTIALSSDKYVYFGYNFTYGFKKQFVFQTVFGLRIRNRTKAFVILYHLPKKLWREGGKTKQLLYFGPSAIITFRWSSLPVHCKLINFLFYFPVLQMFLSSYVKKILNSNDYIRALYAVISGPQVSSVPLLTSYYTVKKG